VAAAPVLSIFLSFLAEAYLMAGRRDEAALVADRGRKLCIQRKERGYEAWATWLCGRIAASQDPPDVVGAEAHYQQALSLAADCAMKPVIAHCHLGLGELYARIARPQEARAELTAATDLYRAMGMTFWLARAEDALNVAAGAPTE
jgi:tetratricopeptide (TPR) repeat protein